MASLSRYVGCAGTPDAPHDDIIHGEVECPFCKAEREGAKERAYLQHEIAKRNEHIKGLENLKRSLRGNALTVGQARALRVVSPL